MSRIFIIHAAALLVTTVASAAPPELAVGICHAVPGGGTRPAGPWAGHCDGRKAQGVGAMRAVTDAGSGVFAGTAIAGRPASGITVLADGAFMLLAPTGVRPNEGTDPAAIATEYAFRNAISGALAAAEAYRRAGNAASARWYRKLAERIERGQPE